MRSRSSSRGLCLVLLVVAATLGASPTVNAGEGQTHWGWHAPPGVDGPGAFRVLIDFGTDNGCTLKLQATGTFSHGPLLWMEIEEVFHGRGSGGGFFHVHSEPLDIDTRGDAHGHMSITVTANVSMDGVRALTVRNVEMDTWMDMGQPRYGAAFDVACADPIQVVGLFGSREVIAVDGGSMSGGTGAHAQAIFVGATVNHEDVLEARFASEQVEVDTPDWRLTLGAYSWTLTTPRHSESASGAIQWAALHVRDGPGTYRFGLTQASADQALELWLVGFDPVPTLNAALG